MIREIPPKKNTADVLGVTGKPNAQKDRIADVYDISTGRKVRIKPRRNWREEKKLLEIVAEHYGYEAVTRWDGSKEIISAFDKAHSLSSENIRRGGKTAVEHRDFYSKHQHNHELSEEVF